MTLVFSGVEPGPVTHAAKRKIQSHLRRCPAGHVWSVETPGSAEHHAAMHGEAGFDFVAIDPRTHEPEEPSEAARPSAAKVVLDLFEANRARLVRDQYGEPYARFRDRRVLPLTKGGAGAVLTGLYLEQMGGAVPPKNAVGDALELLRARALSDAPTEPVYLRFGPLPPDELGRPTGVAIDLGDEDCRAIVIRPGCWAIEPHPINFRRTAAMEALPEPTRVAGMSPDALVIGIRALLNLADDQMARLVVAFLVSLLKPEGPFLGIAMTGPAGAAKTFGARLIRRLIDPTNRDGGGGVRSLPRDPDAFAAIVTGNAIPVFDNLSGATPDQADMLAQVMTGYSNEKRRLYTDDETFQRSAKRPVILTGIDITDRSDLLSRLLVIELEPFESYRTEASLWREFDEAHPVILALVCDAVAGAYKVLPTVREDSWRVRMADSIRFVTAAEPALGWPSGWTEQALADSQDDTVGAVLSTQSWFPPLVAVLDAHGDSYTGSMLSLLDAMTTRYIRASMESAGREFEEAADRPRTSDSTWPKDATRLASVLKRNVSGLRKVGITYTTVKTNGRRSITVVRLPEAQDVGANRRQRP
ncbi:MAG: hypothetical protein U0838_08005 [Chloroflexota bacterium]